MRLHFSESGELRILHLTDLHWTTGTENDRRTDDFVRYAIKAEKPDFIVVTGDVADKLFSPDPLYSIRMALRGVCESGVPWAFAIGNHEYESGADVPALLEMLAAMPNSLCHPKDRDYIIPVFRKECQQRGTEDQDAHPAGCASGSGDTPSPLPLFLIHMLDSRAKTTRSYAGVEGFSHEQIHAYRERCASYPRKAGGEAIPSGAFFHVPLPEHQELWYFHETTGAAFSAVSPPRINAGMFEAMYEEGLRFAFTGHKHMNDFSGDLYGVTLGCTRAGGYTRGIREFKRGARVVCLREFGEAMTTWQRLDDGSAYMPEPHPPMLVIEKKKSPAPIAEQVFPEADPTAKTIIDQADEAVLPKRFRLMRTLDGVGMSGSGQFSEKCLGEMMAEIPVKEFTVVDLRKETHCLVNGMAVSVYGENNATNKWASEEECRRRSDALLHRLSSAEEIRFDELLGKSVDLEEPVIPISVETEEELAHRHGVRYAAFPTTDHCRPTDWVVNAFVEFCATTHKGEWLHFHCRGGAGRTTVFMLMFDMLRNADKESFEAFLERHKEAGGKDLYQISDDPYKRQFAYERLAFIELFYQYCLENKASGFALPFLFRDAPTL